MGEEYPTLTVVQADRRLDELRTNPTYPYHIRADANTVENQHARQLALACDRLRGSLKRLGRAQHFDRLAARIIHGSAPKLPTMMQEDAGFWRWLAVEHGPDLVEYRYGGLTQAGKSRFGIRSPRWNCLLMRLWFRGDISFNPDESDGYRRSELGDVDFWESGVFRHRYGSARNLVRSLIDYSYDDPSEPTRDRWQRAGAKDRDHGIRMVYKNLTRLHATVAFEVLSQEQCADIIRRLSLGLPLNAS